MEAECKEGLAGRAGSAIGFCVDCRYWEPIANGIGFCPLFQKRTEELHGTHCTAWLSKSPNDKVSDGGPVTPGFK